MTIFEKIDYRLILFTYDYLPYRIENWMYFSPLNAMNLYKKTGQFFHWEQSMCLSFDEWLYSIGRNDLLI